jgi:hypothetical protein
MFKGYMPLAFFNKFLEKAKGCWKTEDHPELKDGSEAFVDRLRAENDGRQTASFERK